MTPDREAAIRAAAEALVAAILAAVPAEAAPDAPDRLLSIPEAAAVLGIGRTALYGEIAAGRCRSVKVGRRRLVPASALAEYGRGAVDL